MSKNALRQALKQARQELSIERRRDAGQALLKDLLPKLVSFKAVLSFASLPEEIDTRPLNSFLADSGTLLLPKTVDGSLKIYEVKSSVQLKRGSFGVDEPIPALCKEVSPQEIDIILVPALGFDSCYNRIGYGKGYYDRFLASVHCPTIGIGFKEQRVEKVPVEKTDVSLTEIYLF